jgi:hypothetical protein
LSRKDFGSLKALKTRLPATHSRHKGAARGVKTKLQKAFDDFFGTERRSFIPQEDSPARYGLFGGATTREGSGRGGRT